MKLYAKEATANAIATKLSNKGEAHEVVEHEGQFAVIPQGTSIADMEAEQAPGQTGETGDLSSWASVIAEDSTEQAPEQADEIVTILIPEARLTPCYVITPPIGNSKKGPLERWIERARCKATEATPDGVRLTLSTRELKKRGVSADAYLIKQEETEAA